MRRFEVEAPASALDHPAIVAIYDLGQSESQPFISMELVQGQTLRELLQGGCARAPTRVTARRGDRRWTGESSRRGNRPSRSQAREPDGRRTRVRQDSRLRSREARRRCRCARGARDDDGRQHPAGNGAGDRRLHVSGAGTWRRRGQSIRPVSFGLVLYEMLPAVERSSDSTAVETLSAIIRDDPPPAAELNPSIPFPVRWIIERVSTSGRRTVTVHARPGQRPRERARLFL